MEPEKMQEGCRLAGTPLAFFLAGEKSKVHKVKNAANT
jgi:hypothetical protein